MDATVLSVDWNEQRLHQWSVALRRAGLRVVETRTGSDGLRLAGCVRPDAVLLADGLSAIDALDVCRQSKAQAQSASAGVLLLADTAPSTETQVAALDAGANACLPQSTPPELLIAQINRLRRMRVADATRRGDGACARPPLRYESEAESNAET